MSKQNVIEATSGKDLSGVATVAPCDRYSSEGWTKTEVYVPVEREISIRVNGQELVSILCSPTKLNCLALGFLYAEGIISSVDDVLMMRVCDQESEIDVRLSRTDTELPTRRRLTSGCGGGIAFATQAQKVISNVVVSPTDILSAVKQLLDHMDLYRLSGGVHASALCDCKGLFVVAEDIGRHNTLDKIQGECLLRGISTKDCLLVSTGRISSEMLLKAARMQVPIVASRHSPTGSAISLARDLGITLVGYARGNRLLVYSYPERLGCSSD